MKLRTNKLPGSKPWDERNKDHEARATNVFHTTDLATATVFTYAEEKNKETNKGKTRGRHPSANKEREPQQTSVMWELDYTSRFVRVIPTRSPNKSTHISTGHGGRYMVVTASTSQHPADVR